MNKLEHLIEKKRVFFNYMNENYTIFQYSNLFLRDLQYAIMSYFETIGNDSNYAESEKLAIDFLKHLETENEITKIDYKTWRINFEVGIKKKSSEPEGVTNE